MAAGLEEGMQEQDEEASERREQNDRQDMVHRMHCQGDSPIS